MPVKLLSILTLLVLVCPLQAQEQKSFRKQLLEEAVRKHTRLRLPSVEREAAKLGNDTHTASSKSGDRMDNSTSTGVRQKAAQDDDWTESVISDDLYPESEVHAVVNPVAPRNFIVAAIRQRVSHGTIQDLTCPVYYTLDDGASWQVSPFVTELPDPDDVLLGGGDPVLAADDDGTLYFSWLAFYLPQTMDELVSELYWATSSDGGATWVRPERDVIATARYSMDDPAQNFVDKQWLAVDRSTAPTRGTLYAAYFRASNDRMQIRVRSKSPGARQFDSPQVIVSPDSLAIVQFTSIDVDASGGVHVTWFGSADEQHFSLWHALSTDGGATFPSVTKISDIVFPKFSIEDRLGEIPGMSSERMYPSPQFCADRGGNPGYVYMTWTANGITRKEGNGTDIYFSRSSDNGLSWEAPRIINDDEKGLVRDQFHPSIAVNAQGVVAVTWYDRREDETNASARYYIAVSRDGGRHFLPNRPVAALPMNMYKAKEKNSDFGIGEYTQVIVTDTEILPFWSDGRMNDGNIEIYCARLGLATLDVKELSPLAAAFRIIDAYPSPARDHLRLRLAFDRPMDSRIMLCDMLGRILYESEKRFEAGTDELSLDLSALPSGNYQVVLRTENGAASRQVQILR